MSEPVQAELGDVALLEQVWLCWKKFAIAALLVGFEVSKAYIRPIFSISLSLALV